MPNLAVARGGHGGGHGGGGHGGGHSGGHSSGHSEGHGRSHEEEESGHYSSGWHGTHHGNGCSSSQSDDCSDDEDSSGLNMGALYGWTFVLIIIYNIANLRNKSKLKRDYPEVAGAKYQHLFETDFLSDGVKTEEQIKLAKTEAEYFKEKERLDSKLHRLLIGAFIFLLIFYTVAAFA